MKPMWPPFLVVTMATWSLASASPRGRLSPGYGGVSLLVIPSAGSTHVHMRHGYLHGIVHGVESQKGHLNVAQLADQPGVGVVLEHVAVAE